MKKLSLNIYLIILLLVLSANPALALKCGNALIQEGDTTWEVRTALADNGGKIIGKEKLAEHRSPGYYTPDGGRDYIAKSEPVEKWFISVPGESEKPDCYELTFIGLLLKKITYGVECK